MKILAAVTAGTGGTTQYCMAPCSGQKSAKIAEKLMENVASDYTSEELSNIVVLYADNKNKAFNANRQVAEEIAHSLDARLKRDPALLTQNVVDEIGFNKAHRNTTDLAGYLNNILAQDEHYIIVAGPTVVKEINNYFQNNFGMGNGHKPLSEAEGVLYSVEKGLVDYLP
ncbi:MAG: hypothetical protein ACOCQX_00095 [Candidatus Nanoarchaeia archaeon]